MKIFTITMTPINPPLDDAAKNIVIGIANRIKNYRFYFISACSKQFPKSENIEFLCSPFQKTGRHKMGLLQKLYVFMLSLLYLGQADILQFFFTPQPYFSKVYRRLLKRHKTGSIQIIPSIHTLFNKNKLVDIPGLFFSEQVVVHSDYAKKKLDALGIKNVRRIYPGVELKRFKDIPQDETPGDLEIPSTYSKNIIYAGTYKILEDSYSLDDFLKIAREVIASRSDTRFIIACRIRTKEDSRLEKSFIRRIEMLDLNERFLFLQTVENIPSLFKYSSLGVMPLRYPTAGILEIPMVILEMAALEKCVIYGSVAPLEELSEKGIGVRLQDVSPLNFAKSILKFLDDPDAAYTIGKRSKCAVENYFSMDTAAAEYNKLYDLMEGC